MANTATLAVKIVSDSSAARADIGKSSTAVGKWGDRANRTGKAAGKVLAAGIAIAAAAAVKFTQAAAEDAASAQKLADALKQTTGATDDQVAAVEKWIEAQGKALGVADDELRPAMTRLATVTGSVAKAQRLSALAMDISARTGKPLKTVVEGLAKAQTGSITGLAKFGVQVKNSEGKTKALGKVMKDLSNTYAGSAAKAADTAAGRQKRLTVAMDELQEKIGAKLLPVMEKLVDVGFKVIEWIDKNQKLVGILIIGIGSLVTAVWLINAAVRAWTAVQLAFNTVMSLNPVGLIVIAVIALVAAIVIAYKKSETFRKIVDAAFAGVRKAAEVCFNWIKDHWKLILVIITGPVGIAVGLVIKYWDHIKGATIKLVNGVKTALDGIRGAVNAVKGWFREAWASVTGWIQGIIDKIQAAIGWMKELIGLNENGGRPRGSVLPGSNADTGPRGIEGDEFPDHLPGTRTARMTETINVTVQGSLIGTTEEQVGDELVKAIDRARRVRGLPALGT